MSHLEARFAVRLCERGRKGFSLTPDGIRILEAAENLLRSIENFSGIVGSVRGELSGTVQLWHRRRHAHERGFAAAECPGEIQ